MRLQVVLPGVVPFSKGDPVVVRKGVGRYDRTRFSGGPWRDIDSTDKRLLCKVMGIAGYVKTDRLLSVEEMQARVKAADAAFDFGEDV